MVGGKNAARNDSNYNLRIKEKTNDLPKLHDHDQEPQEGEEEEKKK